ncbi:MAG: glycosyltransferase, partial [Campylobacterales bacterium]|nr:glycosyltransferase [Campylobacterales bacterium]
IQKFISESDRGLYDAMNKGLKMSTGDVVGILNSDDVYASSDILEIVAANFQTKNIDCLFGDLEYVNADDLSKVVRYWRSKEYVKGAFHKGWHPAHPTFFVKREFYEKYGLFNLELKIAADYELMLRFLEKYKLKSAYIHKTFVKMRVGGESNRSIKNIIQANIESYRAWKINDLNVGMWIIFCKPLSKVKQFFLK